MLNILNLNNKNLDNKNYNIALDIIARDYVSFDFNGGELISPVEVDDTWIEVSDTLAKKICTVGNEYGVMPLLSNSTGIVFDGFEIVDLPNEYKKYEGIVSENSILSVPVDHTLKAKWRNQNYNICFMGDFPIETKGISEIEYIENTYGAYFDTEVTLNQDSKIEVDFAYTDLSHKYNFIFGARTAAGSNEFEVVCTTNDSSDQKVIRDDYGDTDTRIFTEFVPKINEKMHIVKDANNLYINNELIASHDELEFETSPYKCRFFTTGYEKAETSEFALGKLYGAKIYDGDTLVSDFKPIYNHDSDTYGLYDSKNDKYYYPQNKEQLTGASPEGVTVTVDYDEEVILPEKGKHTPSYTKIIGWSSEPDGQGTVYEVGTPLTNLCENDGETICLYPIYEIKQIEYNGYLVEYIESNGNSAIDTGIELNENSEVICEFAFTNVSRDYNFIFGSRTSAGTNEFEVCFTSVNSPTSNKVIRDDYYMTADRMFTTFAPELNEKFIIDKVANELYINDSLFATHNDLIGEGKQFSTTYSCTIFDSHYGNLNYGEAAIGRLYSFKIYKNGELKANFVPIYSLEENVAGLYDLVTESFFKSISATPFTAGPKLGE